MLEFCDFDEVFLNKSWNWLNDPDITWRNENIRYWDENGQKLYWSIDGEYLVVAIGGDSRWNWLVDMKTLNLYRLDLPESAEIYQFTETEK